MKTLSDFSNDVSVQNDTFQVETFPTQYTNYDTINAEKAL